MVISAGFCISKLMTRLNCVNDTEGCFTSSPALACKRTEVQFSRCLGGIHARSHTSAVLSADKTRVEV